MAHESGWLQIEPNFKEIVVVKDSHPITAGWEDMKCRFFQKHQLGPPKFSFLTQCPKFLPVVSLRFQLNIPRKNEEVLPVISRLYMWFLWYNFGFLDQEMAKHLN